MDVSKNNFCDGERDFFSEIRKVCKVSCVKILF